MLGDYFEFLKKVAIQNPDVLKFRLIKEFIGVSSGFIRLIKRWDNAPHHAEIESFPHHLHNGDVSMPTAEPTLLEIFGKIGKRI